MTENKLNIYQKVNEVKLAISKANLKKSGKNAFAKFEYYELGDFLPFITEKCNEIWLYNHIYFKEDGTGATLTIINTENNSETVSYFTPATELELRGCNKIQALGGVQTYCRRYLYITAYDICENDSFDAVTGDWDKNQEKKQSADYKRFKERVENIDPNNMDDVNKTLEEARKIYPNLQEEQKKECEEIILWIKEIAWIK